LYLIRHADALALGERGITTDEERPLSEKGEAQSEAAATALQNRGIILEKLFTSPLVRARQTADILLRVWARPELTLETCDALAPSGKPRKLSRFLLKRAGAKVGLVGHMTDLADYAGWLIGAKKAQIDIAKSGIALVVCGELPGKGLGELQWLVTPAWF
jgi:phosphohistidine phosphatase